VLAGVADDVVVEVPALIDGKGVRPLAVDPLPQTIMLGVMWPRLLAAERCLAAYLSRDDRYLLQILMADHRTGSCEQAQEALDALMSMPGNEAMAQYYGRGGSK
jgi:alpha-galactosidase